MQLSDQCCSLELSKKLESLRVKQDSLFYWHCGVIDTIHLKDKLLPIQRDYSAFTVAELINLLPFPPSYEDGGFYTVFRSKERDEPEWQAWESYGGLYDKDGNYITSDRLVDCYAKMLIRLLDHSKSSEG